MGLGIPNLEVSNSGYQTSTLNPLRSNVAQRRDLQTSPFAAPRYGVHARVSRWEDVGVW